TSPNGCSATSTPVAVVQSCKLNGEKDEILTSLKLYPNPSNGNFVIELNSDDDLEASATIQVINILGQVAYANNVDVSNGKMIEEVKLGTSVPPGNYFVR